jgi:hypothetical protein
MSDVSALLDRGESEIEKFIDENLSPFEANWLTRRVRHSGIPGPGFWKRSYQIGSADTHHEIANARQTTKSPAELSRNSSCAMKADFFCE